jgi:hypothetical protein
MRRRFSRVTLAITAVAIVAIAGGVTYAVADIGGGGVINGCYKSQNGQLRLIDPATGSCLPSEAAISWNQTGPTGPQGQKGDKGDPGLSATPLFAVVNGRSSPPTIVRGAHATSVQRSNLVGAFVVFFDRNVRDCAYVATIGLPGAVSTEQPGFITTVGAAVSADAVFVTTHDVAGTLADRSFHLQVSCDSTAASASAEAQPATGRGSSNPLRKRSMLNSPGRKGH